LQCVFACLFWLFAQLLFFGLSLDTNNRIPVFSDCGIVVLNLTPLETSMSQPIKVPKEVMELVYEQAACEALAKESGWLRAIVYKQKALKLEALIWRTMNKVFPQTMVSEWAIDSWVIDSRAGLAMEKVSVATPLIKKPRKSRAAKPAADPANSLGE
jgi:hypothetical protein